MDREDILNKIRKDFPILEEKYNIKKVGLFGSYALGNANKESDIDLLIDFYKPIGFKFFELLEFLEEELEHEVDIITEVGLEKIRVDRVKKSIKDTIIYLDELNRKF
ncbi:MAG: nucleotidyltransferase family protein [Fusobacteriota bacterium]